VFVKMAAAVPMQPVIPHANARPDTLAHTARIHPTVIIWRW